MGGEEGLDLRLFKKNGEIWFAKLLLFSGTVTRQIYKSEYRFNKLDKKGKEALGTLITSQYRRIEFPFYQRKQKINIFQIHHGYTHSWICMSHGHHEHHTVRPFAYMDTCTQKQMRTFLKSLCFFVVLLAS